MKKITSSFLSIIMALVMVLIMIPECAHAETSAVLAGPAGVKPGDSVTLTLSLKGSDIYGLTTTLDYDSSALTFTNYNCTVNGWSMDVSGTNFILYGTSPIGSSGVLSVTFTVNSDVTQESNVAASFKNIVVSNGDGDENASAVSWKGAVDAPKSKECSLSSLSCSNATLSPAFSSDNLYYTTTVPFNVSALNLSISPKDGNASYSINGNNLVVGTNTVSVVVKAQNGDTKTYTITVTRQQDPNYKKSNDASLSEITLDVGQLSPAFKPEITEYVAYVPYETESAKLVGKANSSKAIKVTESTASLTEEGDTPLAITCTAEDGTTTQTYTVHVFRMPLYEGILPTVFVGEPEPEPEVIEEPEPEPEVIEEPEPEVIEEPSIKLPVTLNAPFIGEVSTKLFAGVVGGILALILLIIGIIIGRASSIEYVDDDDDEDDEEDLPKVKPSKKNPVIETPVEKEVPATLPAPKPEKPVKSRSAVKEAPAKEEIKGIPAAPVAKPAEKVPAKKPVPVKKVPEKPTLFDFDTAPEENIHEQVEARHAEKAAIEAEKIAAAAQESIAKETANQAKKSETDDILTSILSETNNSADDLVGSMSIDDILNDIHNM